MEACDSVLNPSQIVIGSTYQHEAEVEVPNWSLK